MAVAEVLELQPHGDDLDVRFAALLADLRELGGRHALTQSGRFQDHLLALDAEILADDIAAGATDRELEEAAGRGTTRTRTEASRRARRARAVHENPDLARALAGGELRLGGLDAIAEAAAESEGAAARDVELVERVKSAPPDQARPITRAWLDERTSPEEHEERYQRQRRLRKVSKYPTRKGLMAITAEADREHIEELWRVLTAESKRLFRLDGGRDLDPALHPRTRNQRLFDALHGLVTAHGPSGRAATASRPEPNRAVQMYVTLTLDQLVDGATKARLVGGGTIPRSLLRDYLAGDASVAGVLFDGDGHVLWHGRNKRWATAPQLSALVARDEGCVLCHRHPAACEGHHLIPFNAPARGRTDTDELAHLCTDCHHQIHASGQTLYCEPDPSRPGRLAWKLRSATADELPP